MGAVSSAAKESSARSSNMRFRQATLEPLACRFSATFPEQIGPPRRIEPPLFRRNRRKEGVAAEMLQGTNSPNL